MKKNTVIALLACIALYGCGYHAGALFRDDIRTIYVQGFDNQTFRRGLEASLTRAVCEEIKLRTPFIFAPRDEADSILSGKILDVQEKTKVESERGRVLVRGVSLTVLFRWRDRLTGADITPEQTIDESARLRTGVAETGVGVGGEAAAADLVPQETSYDAVFQQIAQRIVENMQKSW